MSNNTFFDMTQGGQEIPINLELNTLQTTIRDGKITTGRNNDEQLVFFKKDRNTPENRKDLNDGKLSLVINNISSSFVDNGVVDLSEFISDKISWLKLVLSFENLPGIGSTLIPNGLFNLWERVTTSQINDAIVSEKMSPGSGNISIPHPHTDE